MATHHRTPPRLDLTRATVEQMLTAPSPDPVDQWIRDQIVKALERLKQEPDQ